MSALKYIVSVFRFSLMRLLASVAIIATGTAILLHPPAIAYPVQPEYKYWMLACPLIGAGACLLFKRPIVPILIGAAIGFWVQHQFVSFAALE